MKYCFNIKKQGFGYLKFVSAVLFFTVASTTAQTGKEPKNTQREAKKLLGKAAKTLEKGDFAYAEADYRKAISIHEKDATGKYNLGTTYYGKNKNEEAMLRFKQAAGTATTKTEKHKAFHNLGNTFMNEKKYQEAVEAYKSALRNNPKDEETRYNLALAKDMLEKNPPESGGGDDEKDKEEQDKNEQNQDQKDKNEENEDKQNEGDKGDEKEEKDQGGEEDEKKEGDKNQKKAKPNEPKDGQQEQQPKQPVPGQLSPQQVKNLLEAMNNEEKKVQDKINAQKQKGAKVRPTKDW